MTEQPRQDQAAAPATAVPPATRAYHLKASESFNPLGGFGGPSLAALNTGLAGHGPRLHILGELLRRALAGQSTRIWTESPSTQPEMYPLPFNLPPSPTERIAAQLRALPLALTLPDDIDQAAAMLARRYDPRALIAALERILAAAAETGATE